MNNLFGLKRKLMKGAVAALMLLGTAGTAAGQTVESSYGYVIYYNSYYLPSSTTGTTTFDPNTCIWFGTSGQSFTNGEGYYLNRTSQNNFTVSNTGTAQTGWTINGTESGTTGARLYYDANTDRYLYLNSTTWAVNGNNTTTANRYCLFSVTKYTYAASGTAATISGPTTISTTGTSAATYTRSANATGTAGYIDYKFYNNTSHLRNAADNSNLTSAPTATAITSSSAYTWSLEGISSTYAEINSSTGVVNYKAYVSSDQTATVKLTATYEGLSLVASYSVTFEAPKEDPTSLSITSTNPMTVYVGNTGNITYSLTPSSCYNNVSFNSASSAIATVNGSGVVTGVATGTTTITVTALKIDGTTTSDLTKTVNVNVRDKVATPVITFTPDPSDNTQATATITCTTPGTTIYYTIDDSDDPTTSDLNYTTTGAFTVNEHQVVKAIAVKTTDNTYWDNSDVETGTYVSCSTTAPVITYVPSGSAATVTITAEAGATIYYTTNGNDPTSSSASGTTTVTINNVASDTTVKAYAKNGTCQASATVSKEIIVSNVTGGVVTLFDYEDHTWTYYSGVDAAVDGGNYNTNYLGKLYSPNPRNVKITYKANGGAVSIEESETTFVYYKTLEEGTTTGQYPYQVISNPFSKRPAGKGFGGWKITSGADYVQGHSTNDVLDLDEEITFVSLPYPSVNCTSAEIVFEATWETLNDITYASGNTITYSVSGGTYETNILVLNRNVTGTITASSPVTIMMVEPDGSTDYRGSYTFTGNITPNNDGVTKIEWAKWNPSGDINATGRNVTIGRGLTMGGTTRTINGTNSNSAINQVLKIESGTYQAFYAIGSSGPNNNMTKQHIIFGNDYDRAKADNSNLTITNNMMLLNRASIIGTDKLVVTSKSGQFTTQLDHTTAQASGNCFYLWNNSSTNGSTGVRTLIIEGGEFWHIAGGVDYSNSNDDVNLKIRMKGGTVHGSIYGGAARYDAHGGKQFVFTGGTIEGWIAGGSNGFLSEGSGNDNGSTQGNSYIYVGGNTQVNSNGSTTAINVALGGNVYGAGCGNENVDVSGRVTLGTNVVAADNCYVERGVYGGGAYGGSPATANVYITGSAHIGSVADPTFNVDGGVYGGARAKGGGVANIYMTGGINDGSIYGGCNRSGNLSGAVSVKVYGGTVSGGVYGCNNVGGAPQSTVTVDVYGTDAAPSANTYAINQVFGGGNQADYGGTPVVTVHCPTDEATPISIGELYGGGNQATVAATNVTIGGGNVIGDVYGGGRQANVNGATSVTVNGGTMRRVFGGNNQSGSITGAINVYVNKTGSCLMKIGELYGGGNVAGSAVGNLHIGCTGDLTAAHATANETDNRIGYELEGIGDVYGGANAAPVTGNVSLTIDSGMVYRVFGANNTSNTVSGTVTVTIDKKTDACGWYVGYVYGGGNMAPYGTAGANYPAVNVKAGLVSHNVYGGGKGNTATVTGNPQVTLEGTAEVGGNIYGGGDAANVTGSTKVTLKD